MRRCQGTDSGLASSDSQPIRPPCREPVPTRPETASTSQHTVPGLPIHRSAYPAAIQGASAESKGGST